MELKYHGLLFVKRAYLVLIFISLSIDGYAGVMGQLALHGKAHSFRPLEAEETPNYYSVGPYGSFGYSFGKIWDLALFASYSPSKLKKPEVGIEDAQFVYYGLETGFRLARSIFFGIQGGLFDYNLIRSREGPEIDGDWSGLGGAFVLGGLVKASRRASIQVTLNIGTATIEEVDAEEVQQRRIDWIGVSVGYVYIGLDSLSFGNVFLNDWLAQ